MNPDDPTQAGAADREERRLRSTVPPPRRLRANEKLGVVGGRYATSERIGRGGMAGVYLARDQRTGRSVAVKILHRHLARNRQLRRRFQNEIIALFSVRHPNVVRVLDHGEHDGRPYLVMELVQGITLAQHIMTRGALGGDVVLQLARHAARGLCALHAAGIIHRDVKPGNLLLLEASGEPYALKVVDFGLARLSGDGITGSGVVVGTSSFMAPEQVATETVDPRTDVYALGTVMFAALTAQLPFGGKNQTQMMAHQLLSAAPPPSWLVDDLDDDVDCIVSTALRKAPENRYPTMTAMLEDIERALQIRGEPVVGVPPSDAPDSYSPRSETGRHIVEVMQRDLAAL